MRPPGDGPIAVAVAATGDARPDAEDAAHADVRQSVTVKDSAPRLLLAGPGRLLHVDVEDRGQVTLFRVPRRAGVAGDCGSQPPRSDAIIDMGAKHASLDVPRDESICLMAAAPARGRVSVSWHGRHASEAERAPPSVQHASLR